MNIAIAVGGGVGFLLILIIVIVAYKKCRKSSKEGAGNNTTTFYDTSGNSGDSSVTILRNLNRPSITPPPRNGTDSDGMSEYSRISDVLKEGQFDNGMYITPLQVSKDTM